MKYALELRDGSSVLSRGRGSRQPQLCFAAGRCENTREPYKPHDFTEAVIIYCCTHVCRLTQTAPPLRMDGPDINDDAVYTLETIQVFKAEEPGPNEYDEVGGSFFMTTGGNSALCGVRMETDGTEYLIDIGRLRYVGAYSPLSIRTAREEWRSW